jgi:hypothetical protein
MADQKISELTAADTLAGTETLPVVQGGSTKKATVAQVLAGAQPLDSDLTAIAALSTTSYGRALLALANEAALTALITALASTTADSFVANSDGAATAQVKIGTVGQSSRAAIDMGGVIIERVNTALIGTLAKFRSESNLEAASGSARLVEIGDVDGNTGVRIGTSSQLIVQMDTSFLGVNTGWQINGSASRLKFGHADQKQTTVGAAGGASALPATPTGYFKVRDSAGTEYVIPFYAAS